MLLWWAETARVPEKIHWRQSLDAFAYNEVQTGLWGLMAILTEGTGGTGRWLPTPPGSHSRFLIMIKQLSWHSTSVSASTFVFSFLSCSLPTVPQLRKGTCIGSSASTLQKRRKCRRIAGKQDSWHVELEKGVFFIFLFIFEEYLAWRGKVVFTNKHTEGWKAWVWKEDKADWK